MHNLGQFCRSFLGFSKLSYGGVIMAILGLLVIGFFLYFILNKNNVDNSKNIETPLELLQKRFVNGEINEEEYLEKKKVLS